MNNNETEEERLFFLSEDGTIIDFVYKDKMKIYLGDKLYNTQIVLDKEAIQTLKYFINRLELNEKNLNLN